MLHLLLSNFILEVCVASVTYVFETLAPVQPSLQHNILEDLNPHQDLC
jgi:hypothetical protein